MQLIRWTQAETIRLLGRRSNIKLELLHLASLRDLQRLPRDLDHEVQVAARNARLRPQR